jgi:hypothetical protein
MQLGSRGEPSGCSRSSSRSAWTSLRPTSTCSTTPLPTSGWSSISDVGDARRQRSRFTGFERDQPSAVTTTLTDR